MKSVKATKAELRAIIKGRREISQEKVVSLEQLIGSYRKPRKKKI